MVRGLRESMTTAKAVLREAEALTREVEAAVHSSQEEATAEVVEVLQVTRAREIKRIPDKLKTATWLTRQDLREEEVSEAIVAAREVAEREAPTEAAVVATDGRRLDLTAVAMTALRKSS